MNQGQDLNIPNQLGNESSSPPASQTAITPWSGWYSLLNSQYKVTIDNGDLADNLDNDDIARAALYKRVLRYVTLKKRYQDIYQQNDEGKKVNNPFPRTSAQNDEIQRQWEKDNPKSQQSSSREDSLKNDEEFGEFLDFNALTDEAKNLNRLLGNLDEPENLGIWENPVNLNRLKTLSRGLPDPGLTSAELSTSLIVENADMFRDMVKPDISAESAEGLVSIAMMIAQNSTEQATAILTLLASKSQAGNHLGSLIEKVMSSSLFNAEQQAGILTAAAGNIQSVADCSAIIRHTINNGDFSSEQRMQIFSAAIPHLHTTEHFNSIVPYVMSNPGLNLADRIEILANIISNPNAAIAISHQTTTHFDELIRYALTRRELRPSHRITLLVRAAEHAQSADALGKIVEGIKTLGLGAKYEEHILATALGNPHSVEHADAIIQQTITNSAYTPEQQAHILMAAIGNEALKDHLNVVADWALKGEHLTPAPQTQILCAFADNSQRADYFGAIIKHVISDVRLSPQQQTDILARVATNSPFGEHLNEIAQWAITDPKLTPADRTHTLAALAGNPQFAESLGNAIDFAVNDASFTGDMRTRFLNAAVGNSRVGEYLDAVIYLAAHDPTLSSEQREHILVTAANNPTAEEQLITIVSHAHNNQLFDIAASTRIKVAAHCNPSACAYLDNVNYALNTPHLTSEQRTNILVVAATDEGNVPHLGSITAYAAAHLNPEQESRILAAAGANTEVGEHIDPIIARVFPEVSESHDPEQLLAMGSARLAEVMGDELTERHTVRERFNSTQRARCLATVAANPKVIEQCTVMVRRVLDSSSFDGLGNKTLLTQNHRANIAAVAAGNPQVDADFGDGLIMEAVTNNFGAQKFNNRQLARIMISRASNQNTLDSTLLRHFTPEESTKFFASFAKGPGIEKHFKDVQTAIGEFRLPKQRAEVSIAAVSNHRIGENVISIAQSTLNDDKLSGTLKANILRAALNNSELGAHTGTIIKSVIADPTLDIKHKVRVLADTADKPHIAKHAGSIIDFAINSKALNTMQQTQLLTAVASNSNASGHERIIHFSTDPDNPLDAAQQARLLSTIVRATQVAEHICNVINHAVNSVEFNGNQLTKILVAAAYNSYAAGQPLDALITHSADPRLSPEQQATILAAVASNDGISKAQTATISRVQFTGASNEQAQRKVQTAIAKANARSLITALGLEGKMRFHDLTHFGGRLPGDVIGFCKGPAVDTEKGSADRLIICYGPPINEESKIHHGYIEARRQIMDAKKGPYIFKLDADMNKVFRMASLPNNTVPLTHRNEEPVDLLPDGKHLENAMTKLQNKVRSGVEGARKFTGGRK